MISKQTHTYIHCLNVLQTRLKQIKSNLFNDLTWINVTISTLLKNIKLDRVDSMLSSNTDGVGNTTS